MNINIREQALAGIGQRFEIELSAGRHFVVIATRDGGRAIGVTDDATDEATTLALTAEQAVMIGALLLGARFAIDTTDDDRVDGDTVIVDTVIVSADAPSIGRRPSALLDPLRHDATVLGVIRDLTPEIIEDDVDAPLIPGDRIAIAARKDRLEAAARLFTG